MYSGGTIGAYCFASRSSRIETGRGGGKNVACPVNAVAGMRRQFSYSRWGSNFGVRRAKYYTAYNFGDDGQLRGGTITDSYEAILGGTYRLLQNEAKTVRLNAEFNLGIGRGQSIYILWNMSDDSKKFARTPNSYNFVMGSIEFEFHITQFWFAAMDFSAQYMTFKNNFPPTFIDDLSTVHTLSIPPTFGLKLGFKF